MKPVIFFDWDGTLADSMNLCVAEIRQALITMRLPDLPDDVLRPASYTHLTLPTNREV